MGDFQLIDDRQVESLAEGQEKTNLVAAAFKKEWRLIKHDEKKRQKMEPISPSKTTPSGKHNSGIKINDRSVKKRERKRQADEMRKLEIPPGRIKHRGEYAQRKGDQGCGQNAIGRGVGFPERQDCGKKQPLGRAENIDEIQLYVKYGFPRKISFCFSDVVAESSSLRRFTPPTIVKDDKSQYRRMSS